MKDYSESNEMDMLEVVQNVIAERDEDGIAAKKEASMNASVDSNPVGNVPEVTTFVESQKKVVSNVNGAKDDDSQEKDEEFNILDAIAQRQLVSQGEDMDEKIRAKSVARMETSLSPQYPTSDQNMTVHDVVIASPAPPGLRRQARAVPDRKPGAYPIEGVARELPEGGQPGNRPEGSQSSSPSPPAMESPTGAHTIQDPSLTEAVPVKDDPAQDLEAAEPVDLNAAAARKRSRTKKLKRFVFMFAACMLAVVVAVVFSLVFGTESERDEARTIAPTSSESLSSTEAISAAPTLVDPLAGLIEVLPASTLLSLNNITTPQWKAMDWLSRHPDLPDMPLWRQTQLLALGTFFHAMKGEHWRQEIQNDWMLYEKNECYWFSTEYGLFVKDHYKEREVYTNACSDSLELLLLDLNGLKLDGQQNPFIPPEIDLLTSLSILSLHECGIEAQLEEFLPKTVFQMNSLNKIHLQGNALTGVIPQELQEMQNLTDINLLRNRGLTGSLQYVLPPKLQRLDMLESGTGFGPIPTEVGQLSKLIYLDLGNIGLTGTLPSELGQPTKLDSIYAYDQYLTGALPTQIGLMSSMHTMQMMNNSFTGSLPTEMGVMKAMDRLRLHLNGFSGTLPAEMVDMANLNWFELGYNQLSGQIPTNLSLLPRLQHLFLQGNSLTGPLSPDIGDVDMLQYLFLDNNQLSGSLPTQLGQLGELEWLLLHDNGFSGSIPTEMGNATGLIYLTLGSTAITGEIPSELGLLSNLVELDLSNTLLSGAIPLELADLVGNSSSLMFLNVSGTGLTGTIPLSLCALNKHDGDCLYPKHTWWEPELKIECGLAFDCSKVLCGCGCPCAA